MYVVIHDGRIVAIASCREIAEQGANGHPRTIQGPYSSLDFSSESLLFREVKRSIEYGAAAG